MGYMILEFTFKDNAFAQIWGDNIKFWELDGLPNYEGGLDGFAELYPLRVKELLAKKAIKIKT